MSIKKVFSLLMLSAMIVSLPLFAQSASAQNVLVYDGFEVSYDGWVGWGDFALLEARADAAYNGSRGMRVVNRRAPTSGAASDKVFYIEAGDNIGFSVFARHGGTRSETFNLTLQWRYPESDRTGSAVVATAAAQPNQWVELSGRYTIPAGTANPIFIITTNSTVDFDFDDFKITGGQTRLQKAMAMADDDIQPNQARGGLQDVFARHFRVGNILNSGTVNNAGIREMFIREFNSVTAENEHKPDQTKDRGNSTNTNIRARFGTGAAAINNFAAQNNIPLRDHALTWHGQTPDWFFIRDINDNTNYRQRAVADVPWATPATMNQRLESYIQSKFALYRTQYPTLIVYAVDVVNEYVWVDGNQGRPRRPGFDAQGAGGLQGSQPGNSAWTAIYHGTNSSPSQINWTGTFANTNNWLWRAFHYARQYAPAHTKLFYNDYNEFHDVKRDYIIAQILNPLHERGLIDGMGMQGHVSAENNLGGWSSWTNYRNAMDRYARVGNAQRGFLDVQITELDIGRASTEANQTQYWTNIFSHAITVNGRGEGRFTAICIWGPNDNNSWRGSAEQVTLHNAQNQRKAAANALVALVPQGNWGDGSNPPCCPITGGTVTPSFMVTVNGGTGGGNRQQGSTVTITATVPSGMQFVNWTTTTQGVTFANANNATTTFVMPGRAVTVTANFGCPTVNPNADGFFFVHNFNTATAGAQGWVGRGTATVARSTAQASSAPASLLVSGRTDTWHGAELLLDQCAFRPGNTYSFSAMAMTPNAPTDTLRFQLTMSYELRDTTRFAAVASANAPRSNGWVRLQNTEFAIPAGASDMRLYVEMPNSTNANFHIDDVMGGIAGAGAVIEPDANGYFFHHTFENGTTQGWAGRHGPTVANTAAHAANGTRSLHVSNRSAGWQGAVVNLDMRAFVPGNAYSFSGIAMYPAGPATTTFKLTVQYDLAGETVWAGVDSTVAQMGRWVMLQNQNFTIPAGASNLMLYVETLGDDDSDFYIDDMMGGIRGAQAPGAQAVSVANARNNARQMSLVTVKSNSLTINAQPHEQVQVRVVNMTGKTVARFNAKGGANLSLRKVPAGVYVVEANVAGSTAVVRQRVTLKK